MKWFYFIFFVAVLLNVFYAPCCFTDRFFTAGMLWVGITVGVLGGVWLAVAKGTARCSWGTVVAGIVLVGFGVWELAVGKQWQSVVYGCALVVLMLVMNNSVRWLSLASVCWVVALLAGVEALIAWGQSVKLLDGVGRWRAVGSFDNPAGFSAYLALSFPCVLYLLRDGVKWRRWVAWGVAGSIVLTMVLSGSRTGILAVAVESFVTGWFVWEEKKAVVRRWLAGVAVVLVVGCVVLYHWKKDSADGRLLIWRCTADMIADAPWFGHGRGSFNAKYMDYQANFLREHPGGKWELLADNVKHPFNEFLKICAEFGIVGLLAVCGLLWGMWRRFGTGWRSRFPLFVGWLGLGVCGLFSYPLSYPSVQILACLLLGMIWRDGECIRWEGRLWKCGAGVIVLFVFVGSCFWHRKEYEWWRVSQEACFYDAEEVRSEYGRLYPVMKGNPLFLYNYGAELNRAELWKESHKILSECLNGWNDMDVHMLLADALKKSGNYVGAEEHLLRASDMCPNRFMPLYRLMKIYRLQGKREEAEKVASEIVDK